MTISKYQKKGNETETASRTGLFRTNRGGSRTSAIFVASWKTQLLLIAPFVFATSWPLRLRSEPEQICKWQCRNRRFYTGTLLHTEAFTQRSFCSAQKRLYTKKLLHRETFTQGLFAEQAFLTDNFTHRSLQTQKLLHRKAWDREAFPHRSYYTQTPFHTEAFSLYTEELLHIDAFIYTHRSSYTERLLSTQKLLHGEDFAQRSLLNRKAFALEPVHRAAITDAFLHSLCAQALYIGKLLHREAFPHRSFFTQRLLHTNAFLIPLYMYQVTSGQAFCSTPRCRAYRMSWFQVYKMGGGGGWVRLPRKQQWTKKQTKNRCLQNACPKFISRPQAQSSYKLVSYRAVGVKICLACTCATSPGNIASLFPVPEARSFLGQHVSTPRYRFFNQSML